MIDRKHCLDDLSLTDFNYVNLSSAFSAICHAMSSVTFLWLNCWCAIWFLMHLIKKHICNGVCNSNILIYSRTIPSRLKCPWLEGLRQTLTTNIYFTTCSIIQQKNISLNWFVMLSKLGKLHWHTYCWYDYIFSNVFTFHLCQIRSACVIEHNFFSMANFCQSQSRSDQHLYVLIAWLSEAGFWLVQITVYACYSLRTWWSVYFNLKESLNSKTQPLWSSVIVSTVGSLSPPARWHWSAPQGETGADPGESLPHEHHAELHGGWKCHGQCPPPPT